MKFKYYIFLSSKSFFYKKTNILNIFLFVLSMTMIVLVSSFSKSFNNFINNQIYGNINSHILLVNDIEDKDDLSDINNIKYMTDSNTFSHYVKTKNNETIKLVGVPDDFLKIINGKNFSDVLEDEVMICPSEFYLGNNPEKYDKDFLKNIHSGKELINTSFILESINYQKDYKIIGMYDINKYTYGEYNICFTKEKNIKKIYTKEIEKIKEECNKEGNNCDYIDNYNSIILVVKDINKIDETQKEIQAKGYMTMKLSNIDTSGIDFITTILLIVSISIMIVNLSILIISNNKFIQYNKKNNLIYKSLGYSNKILTKVNYLESIMLSIVCFAISIILWFVLYKIINNIFSTDIKTGFQICISYLSIIYSFISVLLVSLLSVYISINKKNNSIIKEFDDGEI